MIAFYRHQTYLVKVYSSAQDNYAIICLDDNPIAEVWTSRWQADPVGSIYNCIDKACHKAGITMNRLDVVICQ